MSDTRTHKHTPRPPRGDRQAEQRRITQRRRDEEALRKRYEADDRVPDAEEREHHLDAPRYRP